MTAYQETVRTFIATAISTEAHRVLEEAAGRLRQEARLPYERLARMHRQLVETDLAMKTTGVDEQLALELLIAEMSLG